MGFKFFRVSPVVFPCGPGMSRYVPVPSAVGVASERSGYARHKASPGEALGVTPGTLGTPGLGDFMRYGKPKI
jgi:hypothetical protein